MNSRKGTVLSDSTKAKISIAKKADTRPSYVKSPKFKPWFISEETITHLFYTTTKSEYAIANGYSEAFIRDSANSSKGVRKLTRGQFKGLIVGNIPTYISP